MKRSALLLAASQCLLTAPALSQVACGSKPEAAVQAVNQVRAMARPCGSMPAAGVEPVSWDERLAESAARYAAELARRDELSHRGQTVVTLKRRLFEVDYPMDKAGENLSSGSETIAQALQLWLASAEHCANLMEPGFIHVGLACAESEVSGRAYWVMHLAAPVRSSPGR